MERWALERSDFRNAHFSKDGGWEPADFLGGSRREQRKIERAKEAFEVMRLNQSGPLNEEEVPDWALAAARKAKENGDG